MASIVEVRKFNLDLQPSCIEFLPASPNWLVVGTYHLLEPIDVSPLGTSDEEPDGVGGDAKAGVASQSRHGSVILGKVENGEWRAVQTIVTKYAILDIHFHPQNPTIFAGATSTGSLTFFRITTGVNGGDHKITHQTTIELAPSNVLITSFAWSSLYHYLLAVTLSTGEVTMVNLPHTSELWTKLFEIPQGTTLHLPVELGISMTPHQNHNNDYAWIVAFMPNGVDLISGGDDAALRGFCTMISPSTTAARDQEPIETKKYWVMPNKHGAGVTSVIPLSSTTYITGSYDDTIRLLSITKPLEAGTGPASKVLASLHLGGGVWRLKLLDTPVPRWDEQYDILASCMHAGVRIVRLKRKSQTEWKFEILAKFEEHQSMNYASDFQPSTEGSDEERLIVSTSYYDKLLCTWKLRLG